MQAHTHTNEYTGEIRQMGSNTMNLYMCIPVIQIDGFKHLLLYVFVFRDLFNNDNKKEVLSTAFLKAHSQTKEDFYLWRRAPWFWEISLGCFDQEIQIRLLPP